MEAVYYAARANLQRLLQLYPHWTGAQFAQATGMSRGWVSKWKKRLMSVSTDDEAILRGRSRAPHHPAPRLDPLVVDRVLEIRDHPPEELGRTPGPRAILYYLPRDESLQPPGLRLPRSTRTIHQLLREHGRIAPRLPHVLDPIERPKPMQHWQLDFKDASTVPADPRSANNNVSSKLSTSLTKRLAPPHCQSRSLRFYRRHRTPSRCSNICSLTDAPVPSRWIEIPAGLVLHKAVTSQQP